MAVEKYHEVKKALLDHIQSLFEEMEEELALSHQEKYALLEDILNGASDEDELRVAFEQWYNEHVDEIGWDYKVVELWNQAVGDKGVEVVEDDEEDKDEDGPEEELPGFGSDEEDEGDKRKNDFKNSDED